MRHSVITRTRSPLRLGLAGGGTDLSPFSEQHGGAVLNCTIDRYAYSFLAPRQDGGLAFRARDLDAEEAFSTPEAAVGSRLDLHRGVYFRIMREFNRGRLIPMTITTTVDAPSGSGLGSSSALVVSMIDAFRVLLDLPLGQYDVAQLAYEIEREDLGLSGGKQDQYAAAFGGINFIEFLTDKRVLVNPLRVPTWIRNELESSLVIAFSGQSRSSAKIIDQQRANLNQSTQSAIDAMLQLKHDAFEMKRALLQGLVSEMAAILDRSWASKKATASGISNSTIDEIYELARANGAIGGKVSGAGGGGFMMFMCAPENRLALIETLNKAGANASPVKFTEAGSETWQTKA